MPMKGFRLGFRGFEFTDLGFGLEVLEEGYNVGV